MTSQSDVEKGIALFKAKKYSEAIQVFQKCLDSFISENDLVSAAEMSNNLSVAYLQAKQPQKAYEIVLGTDQVFESAGDKRRQAMAISNIATALESLHRDKEALERYEDSLSILETLDENEMRSDVHRRIAALQLKLGHSLEAVNSMESSWKRGNSQRGKVFQKILGAIKKLFLGY